MEKLIKKLLKNNSFSVKSQGSSMMPILQPDDVIYYKKTSFGRCQVNDLIMVEKNRHFFTHRVVYKKTVFKKDSLYLITKGDNNLRSDAKIYPKQILGRVYRVKRKGRTLNPESLYLLQSTLYFQEIVKIKKLFEHEKIDFVFLKGLPLHLYYEKSHPRRIYLDCDVLIDKKDFLEAEKILFKNGYQKPTTELSTTHQKLKGKEVENAYVKTINGFPVVFDLHLEVVFMMTQLGKLEALYPQKLIDQLTKEFLKTKRKVKINNEKFLILNSEFLILYLALHFFHHNFRGAFRLEFLTKIIASHQPKKHLRGVFWLDLASKIKAFQLQNFVSPVFVLLKKFYKTPIPSKFIRSIQPSNFYLQYLSSILHPPSSIFNDEPRISAGINRFKNLFFLSPQPLWRKLLVFFNPQVLYSIFWVFWKKLPSFFSTRQ